jgi:MFS family permease
MVEGNKVSVPSAFESKSLFGLVAIGIAFDLINVTGAITSTLNVQSQFNISSSKASWVLTTYSITLSGFIAILGRVADIIGNFTLFLWSCLMFSVTSLICALPVPFEVLLVFRALQGVGAAGMIPSGYAIVNYLYPEGDSAKSAFSILSSVFSLSFGIGFIVGGAFDQSQIGYKGIYYVSFATTLLVCVLVCVLVKRIDFKRHDALHDTRLRDLDFFGCFIFISGSSLLVAGFTQGGEGWKLPSAYVCTALGAIFLLLFFCWNIALDRYRSTLRVLRSIKLLVPRGFLTVGDTLLTLIALFLNYAALFSTLLLVCYYLQHVEDYNPLVSSLMLLPAVGAMTFSTVVLAIWPNIFNPKLGCCIGFSLMFTGSLVLRLTIGKANMNVYWCSLFITELLLSFGSAIFFPISLNLLIGLAPAEYKALVSGIAQTFAQFGVTVGFSVLASVLGDMSSKTRGELRVSFVDASNLILASGALGLVAILVIIIHPTIAKVSKRLSTVNSVKSLNSDNNV